MTYHLASDIEAGSIVQVRRGHIGVSAAQRTTWQMSLAEASREPITMLSKPDQKTRQIVNKWS